MVTAEQQIRSCVVEYDTVLAPSKRPAAFVEACSVATASKAFKEREGRDAFFESFIRGVGMKPLNLYIILE